MGFPRWTEQETNLLLELWADGKSATDIVAAFGHKFTRSAILGKICRMRRKGVQIDMRQIPVLNGRPRNPRKQPPNYSPVKHEAEKLPPTPLAPEPIAIPLFTGV